MIHCMSAIILSLQLDMRPNGKIIMQIKLYGTLAAPGELVLTSQ